MSSRVQNWERRIATKRRILEKIFKSGGLTYAQVRRSVSSVKDRQIENYLRELRLLGLVEYEASKKYYPSTLWLRLNESITRSFCRAIRKLKKSQRRSAAYESEVGSIAGIDPRSHRNELFAAAMQENFRIQSPGEPAIIYSRAGPD